MNNQESEGVHGGEEMRDSGEERARQGTPQGRNGYRYHHYY